jgi:hypothetical protein
MSDVARPVLVVLKDGAPLDAEEARALWVEFSAHMDANRGDMAGFAKAKGWHAVVPEHRKGQAVLLVWTTAEAKGKAAPPAAPPKEKAAGGRPPGRKAAGAGSQKSAWPKQGGGKKAAKPSGGPKKR